MPTTELLPCGEDCVNCPYESCIYTDDDQDTVFAAQDLKVKADLIVRGIRPPPQAEYPYMSWPEEERKKRNAKNHARLKERMAENPEFGARERKQRVNRGRALTARKHARAAYQEALASGLSDHKAAELGMREYIAFFDRIFRLGHITAEEYSRFTGQRANAIYPVRPNRRAEYARKITRMAYQEAVQKGKTLEEATVIGVGRYVAHFDRLLGLGHISAEEHDANIYLATKYLEGCGLWT